MKPEDKRHPFFHRTLATIRQCAQVTFDPDREQETVEQKGHGILLALKGRGQIYINNRPSQLGRNKAFVIPEGTITRITGERDHPLTVYRLSFDLYRMSRSGERQLLLEREASFPLEGKLHIADPAAMAGLLRRLEAMGPHAEEDGDPSLYQSDLRELFDMLLQAGPAPHDAHDPIRRTIRHMQRHYAGSLTLQTLADVAGSHPTYYSAQFKRRLGISPIDYLNRLRLNRAKELMLSAHDKMKDIARLSGFSDEFYFSRRFKSGFGIPPTSYLRDHLPSRIVSLSSPYTDHLLALGVQPYREEAPEELVSERKWIAARKDGLASWELRRRELLALKPDVLICKEHILAETRMYMGDIAPVVTVPWLRLDCFDHMREIANLTGKGQDAREWIERYESRAERGRRQVARTIGGSSAAICVITDKQIRLYGERNIGHVFYRSLQLAPPDIVRAEMNKHRAGTVFNWMAIPPEQFDRYEADYLFVLVEPKEDAAANFDRLRAGESWQRHPAVRSRRVYSLDWQAWIPYSPYSISRQLNSAVALLSNTALA